LLASCDVDGRSVASVARGMRHPGSRAASPCSVTGPLPVSWVPLPPDVILLAVKWYLRYGLSYRDVEELLAEGGTEVD
jgi:hypothetical protein